MGLHTAFIAIIAVRLVPAAAEYISGCLGLERRNH